jgi:hypothetical protein
MVGANVLAFGSRGTVHGLAKFVDAEGTMPGILF